MSLKAHGPCALQMTSFEEVNRICSVFVRFFSRIKQREVGQKMVQMSALFCCFLVALIFASATKHKRKISENTRSYGFPCPFKAWVAGSNPAALTIVTGSGGNMASA